MIRSVVKKALSKIGTFDEFSLDEISESDNDILRSVKRFTMTSPERVYAILEAVRYVIKANVPGSIVECGVWRGGTMMAVAQLLRKLGKMEKDLYLFDTFEGMPTPGDNDVDFRGRVAKREFLTRKRTNDTSNWCYASLADVQSNLDSVGYLNSQIHYIVGKVEETIPDHAPEEISILRLDTDWYESTKHELVYLYPRLVKGGVLIIDDYGHWQGARKAVEEYFSDHGISLLLNRIDYTGRIGVKV